MCGQIDATKRLYFVESRAVSSSNCLNDFDTFFGEKLPINYLLKLACVSSELLEILCIRTWKHVSM